METLARVVWNGLDYFHMVHASAHFMVVHGFRAVVHPWGAKEIYGPNALDRWSGLFRTSPTCPEGAGWFECNYSRPLGRRVALLTQRTDAEPWTWRDGSTNYVMNATGVWWLRRPLELARLIGPNFENALWHTTAMAKMFSEIVVQLADDTLKYVDMSGEYTKLLFSWQSRVLHWARYYVTPRNVWKLTGPVTQPRRLRRRISRT